MISVNESGTANCQAPVGGGDITGVTAGAGLNGCGVAGDVALAVAFRANTLGSGNTHGLVPAEDVVAASMDGA